MSDNDPIRDQVRAHLRLEMEPEKLTPADVSLLGEARFGLGLRAAIALEVRRALHAKTTKTTTPARRRKR